MVDIAHKKSEAGYRQNPWFYFECLHCGGDAKGWMLESSDHVFCRLKCKKLYKKSVSDTQYRNTTQKYYSRLTRPALDLRRRPVDYTPGNMPLDVAIHHQMIQRDRPLTWRDFTYRSVA